MLGDFLSIEETGDVGCSPVCRARQIAGGYTTVGLAGLSSFTPWLYSAYEHSK